MTHGQQPTLPGAEALRFRAPGFERPAVLAGLGLAVLAVAWLLGRADPVRWLGGYLVAFLFVLTMALGGLFFTLLMHATRAAWGVVLRRLAEAVAATLPLFILLFLPIALGAEHLFEWAGEVHGEGHHAELIAHKSPFLNLPFFYLRATLYLLVWGGMGWWFWRRSTAQDGAPDAAVAARMRAWSHPGIAIFAVTVTLAAFDWIMSLTPTWYSTIFGVYFFAGIALAAMALLAILSFQLEWRGAMAHLLTDSHRHDLGKLLFAFVVFWAYIAFSQFMLIWYANIPEETHWFALRLDGSWRAATMALALGHFVIPFFFLLSRVVKRRRLTLALAAGWLLLLHLLDLAWMVLPSIPGAREGWLLPVALCTLGLGAILRAALIALLERAATVPTGDPRILESLATESG